MFAIGGVFKAYKSIVSKRNSSQQDKNDSFDKSNRKGSNHKERDELHNLPDEDDEDSVSPSFFRRLENLPQSNNKDPPLKRSTSLGAGSDGTSSLSRNMSKNRRNPVSAAANHLYRMVSHKNMDSNPTTSATTKANEFDVSSREHSSIDEFGIGDIPLPRSLSQKSMTTSTSQRHLGRSLSRKYSQKGSMPDLLSTVETGAPPSPVPAMEKSMSRSISRQGTVPIMFSSSNGLLKPQAIERSLDCTLEELCYGSVKKISVARDVINDIGFLTQEEEQLTVRVQQGWSEGTKITFPGTGDGRLGTCPADIVLVITEKRHPMYSRRGDEDLELGVEIPLVDALTGCTIMVPLLGGEKVKLELDNVVKPGLEKIIPGQGMPKQKDEYRSRGNLILKFFVTFPDHLSDEQRLQVYSILSSTTPS
ncbi:uncharacterized protein LOC124925076 [Impatiens glandulifera]|uniref:uncharacterized protein LOC124925076 n=1 Tax=Impatiens glandulifera TaxID=253017 RepID=UPI001FB0BB81|nr:uncharacterized protein LOC124925076 [Impatiens glandulifera]